MRDIHRDPAQDFDPTRAHSKRLVDIAGNQLRLLHGHVSAVNTAYLPERYAKSRCQNKFSTAALAKTKLVISLCHELRLNLKLFYNSGFSQPGIAWTVI